MHLIKIYTVFLYPSNKCLYRNRSNTLVCHYCCGPPAVAQHAHPPPPGDGGVRSGAEGLWQGRGWRSCVLQELLVSLGRAQGCQNLGSAHSIGAAFSEFMETTSSQKVPAQQTAGQ